ncbi:hypothetical protein [Kingella negevensis]|uniref:Roadblock/LC7 domain protein n=1 Tax=Kingella negevensis TaxID=1522312 RepID=A0A238HEE3_9NEIS|nr:hypothetical protein [Kingella negevensis]MDK4679982.1 hypothetical protein [Kingella negevensis]MDK4682298.1 hypothetical protein [Kingella negevensis]MDK4684552.1 hypothetical protein [Kingella negevensis]MDK4688319.1 hypothetical protein [Kingella negevensis]MDK4690495.1 hypothetical protein [Kingella negevensis]
MNLQKMTEGLVTLKGAIAAAIVDYESGMLMASANNDPSYDLEVVAGRGSEVIRAKRRIMDRLAMDDEINDILITLTTQYHLMCPSKKYKHMFIYLAVDRKEANLSRCRQAIFALEKQLA